MRAGMSWSAASISACVAKPSRSPWTKRAGVCRSGKCLERSSVGRLRRMQREREQEESGDECGVGGSEQRSLAATIGMTAEEDAALRFGLHRGDGGAESGLVAFGTAAGRWAGGTQLAEGQVAAQDGETCGAKRFGERDKQRCAAVGACTVGEDEAVTGGRIGTVEESADGQVGGGSVQKRLYGFHSVRTGGEREARCAPRVQRRACRMRQRPRRRASAPHGR